MALTLMSTPPPFLTPTRPPGAVAVGGAAAAGPGAGIIQGGHAVRLRVPNHHQAQGGAAIAAGQGQVDGVGLHEQPGVGVALQVSQGVVLPFSFCWLGAGRGKEGGGRR
jgi:hypothetical protein